MLYVNLINNTGRKQTKFTDLKELQNNGNLIQTTNETHLSCSIDSTCIQLIKLNYTKQAHLY